MHLFFMVEGVPIKIDQFIQRLGRHKIMHENKEYNLHVRKVELYNVTFEDKLLDKVITDIPNNSDRKVFFKSGALRGFLNMIMGKMGLKFLSPEEIQKIKYKSKKNEGYWMGWGPNNSNPMDTHLSVMQLGTLPDDKLEDGTELL